MEDASAQINVGRPTDAGIPSQLTWPSALEAKWVLIWIMYSDNLCGSLFNHRSSCLRFKRGQEWREGRKEGSGSEGTRTRGGLDGGEEKERPEGM